jgi:Ca-activated chloride channel family protein
MVRLLHRVLLVLCLHAGLLAASPVHAAEKVILVLDASGSMWGQIAGKPKIQIAREVIDGILKDWKADNEIGLIAYGHRKKGDCSDIETLVPVGKLNNQAFSKAVNDLNPRGKTPLSDAVRKAAETLKYTEEKATVILVSDGKETCNADPCAVAAELEKAGVDFTAHVVGFDVSEKQGLSQLQCLASNTGGEFFAAKDAAALQDALKTAVKKVEEPPKIDPKAPVNVRLYTTLSAGGKPVGGSWFKVWREDKDQFGKAKRVQVESGGYSAERTFKLAPGAYIATATLGDASAEAPIIIEPGKALEQELNLNAGYLKLITVLSPGNKPVGGSWFKVWREDKDQFGKPKRVQISSGGYSAERTFTVPAGTYVATATLGDAAAEIPVTVEAGKGVEQEINLNAGYLKLITVLSPGNKPVGGSWFKVYREDKDQFGKPKRVQISSGGYSAERTFTVPAGTYVATATLGDAAAEIPVTVDAGKGVEQEINLNAGSLKLISVLSPGSKPADGSWFKVFREDKDEFGKPKRVQISSGGYSAERTFTVPAGSYIAAVTLGDARGETPVTVTAGKDTQQEVNLDAGLLKIVANVGGSWFKVYREDKDEFGKPKRVQVSSGGYSAERSFTVPSGEYLVEVTNKDQVGTAKVKVTAGQAVTTEVSLKKP